MNGGKLSDFVLTELSFEIGNFWFRITLSRRCWFVMQSQALTEAELPLSIPHPPPATPHSGSCYHLSPESDALVSSLWRQIFSCLGQVYVIQAFNLIVTWDKVS